MFVSSPNRTLPGVDTEGADADRPTTGPAGDQGTPRGTGTRARPTESLSLLAERARPVSSSQTRLLPVLPPLAELFPDGGLRRGSTVVVTGAGDGHAGGDGTG